MSTKAQPHRITMSYIWNEPKFWCPVAQTFYPVALTCPHCGKKVKPA